ncbi:trp operon leader peptide [Streptomyces sp. NPDC006430]
MSLLVLSARRAAGWARVSRMYAHVIQNWWWTAPGGPHLARTH